MGVFRKSVCCMMLTLITFSIQGCNTDEDTGKVKNETPVFSMKADDLYKAYTDNEVAADQKYKGKVVEVRGTVQSIGKDITDDAYIVIGSGIIGGVQCSFSKGETGTIAALSKGQRVKVKGKVSGKMMNVQVMHASLL